MKNIVIIAGDKSGDLYGGFLSKKLKEKFSNLEIHSFGGAELALHSHQAMNLLKHSVSGIYEVLSSLSKLIDTFNKTLIQINNIQPDLIILIDFPDFNLRLAKKINRRWPVFYYVSPQVWAWRKKRVEIIKEYVEKIIVLFKFEEDFYKNENINALYFGHPLLEIIKKENVETKKIISLLPGSRKNEIKRHLPVMKRTKKILEKHLKNYQFRIIRAENIEKEFYRKLAPEIALQNHSYRAIEESEFIITSSGTATMEIAILEVPYLIMYKVNPISWQILKRMVKTDYVGMVNILCYKEIIEELLQNNATPKKIAEKTLYYINNKEKYQQIKRQLKEVQTVLAPRGASDKFAEYIGRYLQLSPHR